MLAVAAGGKGDMHMLSLGSIWAGELELHAPPQRERARVLSLKEKNTLFRQDTHLSCSLQ